MLSVYAVTRVAPTSCVRAMLASLSKTPLQRKNIGVSKCDHIRTSLFDFESALLQELAESAGDSPPGRRRLRETAEESITEYLTDLSEGVETLRIGQSELRTQVCVVS